MPPPLPTVGPRVRAGDKAVGCHGPAGAGQIDASEAGGEAYFVDDGLGTDTSSIDRVDGLHRVRSGHSTVRADRCGV
jgi:hypothetical protein